MIGSALGGNTVLHYPLANGYLDFAGGLACGLCGLAAGMCIGIVGDAGVRAYGQQQRTYVTMLLIVIFGEALGIYGLIGTLQETRKRFGTFRVCVFVVASSSRSCVVLPQSALCSLAPRSAQTRSPASARRTRVRFACFCCG